MNESSLVSLLLTNIKNIYYQYEFWMNLRQLKQKETVGFLICCCFLADYEHARSSDGLQICISVR